ncbi:MAG: PAS domain S-box protein, partial [Coriobacteriia bacterium]|nr:PAS domain S-box protein [Coriobacteriia bacterium]
MRVLIVDDDEAGRYLISSIVGSAGHEAILAINGLEALEAARLSPPDVVISDILMPKMDGYQLAREWKSDPILAEIPLVFLTASYTDPADEKFAIELGADGFLSKPVETEVLLETIDAVTAGVAGSKSRLPVHRAEADTLREYSERVVHKLEQKLGELERSNALTESALEALSAEMGTKQRLIDDLHEEIRQRVQNESELRRERDFNNLIIETADVFICSSDAEGTITLFSPGAERISGYTAAEVLGKDVVEVFAPRDERDRRRHLHQAMLQAGGGTRLTNTWIMRSGEERIFEWSATVTRDEQERPSAIIRFGIDVTERSLVVATERVMSVIDLSVLLNRSIPELIEATCAQTTDEFGLAAAWVAFADGHGTWSLRACAGPIAEAALRMLESDSAAACPVGDLAQMDQPVHIALAQDAVPPAWRRMAESEHLHAALLLPIRSEGTVSGVMVALTYNERGFSKSFSRALEAVADRLGVGLMFAGVREQLVLQSAALQSAGNAIVLAEVSGRVGWVNSAFTRLTGYRIDEVVGRNLFPDDEGYHESAYREAWDSVVGGHAWQGEIANHTKDGRPYAESVTLAPVTGRDGTVSHVVIVKADVSERRKFERLRNDFVAMVSHELRTPLTTIIGYADLLTSGSKLDEASTIAAVRSIQTSGQQMRGIVEELLSVTELLAESIDV